MDCVDVAMHVQTVWIERQIKEVSKWVLSYLFHYKIALPYLCIHEPPILRLKELLHLLIVLNDQLSAYVDDEGRIDIADGRWCNLIGELIHVKYSKILINN